MPDDNKQWQPIDLDLSDQFGLDELRFGTKQVHLQTVPGKSILYRHNEWKPSFALEDVRKALARAKIGCNGLLGPSCSDVVIPAIPAVEIICTTHTTAPTNNTSSEDNSAKAADLLPKLLQKPLIKVKKAPDSVPTHNELHNNKAFASGVRSAVVKIEDKWYRLKGCGNNDSGFLIRNNKAGKDWKGNLIPPYRDIRGCAFEATAIRELFMVSEIDGRLRDKGIVSCNKATCYFQYDPPNCPLGETVRPCCIVEETLGDRRLGSHVLSGIEIILPLLVQKDTLVEKDLLSIFPPNRPGRLSKKSLVSTSELMTDYMIAKCSIPPFKGYGISFPDLPRDHTLFGSLESIFLPEKAPNPEIIPPFWTAEGPVKADARWSHVWKETCESLDSILKSLQSNNNNNKQQQRQGMLNAQKKPNNILTYLFSRIGYDCGKFMRGLHDMKASWGTYQDALCRPGQWHCNAHANNVVVLPEVEEEFRDCQSLLSYLDLDMAFTADTYLDTWGSGKIGMNLNENEKETFNHLLFTEHINFMEVLVGADASTGVPQVAKEYVDSHGEMMKLLQTCLYDTLILGYLNAYNNDDEQFPVCQYDETLHRGAHKIMQLATIVMSEFVA